MTTRLGERFPERLCALCGQYTYRIDMICSHHGAGEPQDWADGNRAMCDFFHRGVVPHREPLTPEEMWWYQVDWGQR